MAENPEVLNQPEEDAPRERRGLPWWGILIGFVLLAGMLVLNQAITSSAPPIDWQFTDFDQARAEAEQKQKRIFLYLYTPGEAAAEQNERGVFSQPWARNELVHAICCRVALSDTDAKRPRYERDFGYRGQPLMVVLGSSGQRLMRPVEGAPDQHEFYTYITEPLRRNLPATTAPAAPK